MRSAVIVSVSMGALLAGCGAPVISAGNSKSFQSHAFKTNLDAGGNPVSVQARSINPITVTVTETSAETVDVAFSGTLNNGESIPSRTGLKLDKAASSGNAVVATGSDSFLGALGDPSTNYAAIAYGVRNGPTGNTMFSGVAVSGKETGTMPGVGSAKFNGGAVALIAGSSSGLETAVGTATLQARFGPGAGSISGTISGLTGNRSGARLPFDIALNQSQISGNGFSGSMTVVSPGTTTPIGTTVSSGYDGKFFGDSAMEAAGAFQFEVAGVPNHRGAGTQTVQSVGIFGGSR